ncbi:hypothetical protein ElyMa_004895300 [Elysia marginata]|uniref:C2H2-type domain-containing protein n=1 Tax=Elysia marginata TaxID=1093978 RepID=A0AAV4IXG5_9GAST|nr:hypothetical protein ElyMa_004895300 [Elysia marginata]
MCGNNISETNAMFVHSYSNHTKRAGPQGDTRCDYHEPVLKLALHAATTTDRSSKRCALRLPRAGPQSAARCDHHGMVLKARRAATTIGLNYE